MLTEKYSKETLRNHLVAREDWHPFPTIDNRTDWETIPESIKSAQLTRAEKVLGFAWPALPATRFLDYVRNGNRSQYEALIMTRRQVLIQFVIAECIEDEGRFLDDIANGLWCICEESSWVTPAHLVLQEAGLGLPDTTEPVVDLMAGETAANLAWSIHLLRSRLDRVSPQIVPRVEREIQNRILTPMLEHKPFWWTGFSGRPVNNWNPWIVSNWLCANLLIEPDPARRIEATWQAMRTVDLYIKSQPSDGGCDEGPSYWGHACGSFYYLLSWLSSATEDTINIYDQSLVQELGRYIYRVHISDSYFTNFADAVPRPSVCYSTVYGLGKRIKDKDMMAFGAWLAQKRKVLTKGVSAVAMNIGRMMPALFWYPEVFEADAYAPLPRDVFLGETELSLARDTAGSPEGFTVSAKGGHNAESHNHNDVGHFIVSIDGKPVFVDAGAETYNAKTFSDQRYTLWHTQSQYHNLPTINGNDQAPGRTYSKKGTEYNQNFAAQKVCHQSDDISATFSLDIAQAYSAEAQIEFFHRTLTLHRGQEVVLRDHYQLKEVKGGIILNLLTPCSVEIVEPGKLALKEKPLVQDLVSGTATLFFDAEFLSLETETIEIEDEKLQSFWEDSLTRIRLTVQSPQTEGEYTIRITRAE